MPGETETLSKLLAFLRPGVALTPSSAKHLAWDLRRLAKRCEKFAAGGTPDDNPVCAPVHTRATSSVLKRKKSFDFDRFSVRYVAFRLLYVGWRYHGFTLQENAPNTVEASLFMALERTCLVRPGLSSKDMRYTRCGRTDIGVSALANVVTLEIRSKARSNEPLPEPDDELDYPMLLNKVLPDDIQVTGWGPVDDACNARFSATHRQYKYFFSGAIQLFCASETNEMVLLFDSCPQNSLLGSAWTDQCLSLSHLKVTVENVAGAGGLDVDAMHQAAKYLVGTHDYQHFCKINFGNTTYHRREVFSAEVQSFPLMWQGKGDVVVLVIRGSGFLWHQVRCIAAVLRMVGRGLENPEVIKLMLDIDAAPGRPQYSLAAETPLLLHSTGYPEHLSPRFRISPIAAGLLRSKVENLTQEQVGKVALMYEVNREISEIAEESGAEAQVEQHAPMMRRPKDIPIAVRLAAYQAKQAKRAAQAGDVAQSAVVGKAVQGGEVGRRTGKRDRSPRDAAAEEAAVVHPTCTEKVRGGD